MDADVGRKSHIRGFGFLVSASTISCSVGVVFLKVGIVAHQVLIGIIGPATVAAVIDCHAVNKLLLGQGFESRAEDGVGALDGARSGKSPAGATLGLVLDWGGHASFDPVDVVRE